VRKYTLKESDTPWYQYVPETVKEGKDIPLYRGTDIITDNNRPDITQ
jgi:hypothetical protein